MVNRRAVLSWALYDWGNSAFATTVMAGFFPLFFKQYWSAGADPTHSTLKLGVANSLASVCVAAAAPLLGAIADRYSLKKRLLLLFAMLGIVMTGAMHFVAQGEWVVAVALYVAATVGFSGSIVFYDALLVSVAKPRESDRVSALGYAMGYLGGGTLFAINVAMTLKHDMFGLADKAAAIRVSFLMVAIWWAAASIPLMLFVDEPAPGLDEEAKRGISLRSRLLEAFAELAHTLGEIRKRRNVWIFLAAYWLYIDGVDTIIRMAVDYGKSLGFSTDALITALLITQFVGFPAALLYGRLGPWIGTKNAILVGVATYVGVTIWGYQMTAEWEFYALAIAVGLVQGGVQSLSRALYSRLIPPDKAAEFFGFYNMLGKFAAVVGPTLMGWVGVVTGSPRTGILSIAILLVAGGVLLMRVDDRLEPHDARV
ncbi:MAG: MFS transporter [Myxococcales bacterium]|nr:MFS transporter [Myxococcales bacterium]MDD9967771.1 MFS transporter [Myxococcales bacterium]